MEVQASELDKYWRISGVNYLGGIHTVDLMKKLLDEGREKTQDKWAAHYERKRDRDEFHTPDYPLFYGLVKALYAARDDSAQSAQIVEAQKFIKNTSRSRRIMTLTRIAYQSTGDDLVIHNYGTRDSYERHVDFITSSEWITDTSKPASYQALLDTQDSVQDIDTVLHWFNGTNTYAWKINSKPDKVIERVGGFNASSGWAGLSCYRNLMFSDPTLGVRLHKKV